MEPWVYVVLLGIAVMVYAILQPDRSRKSDKESIGQFEETLDRFAEVLEEDNRELLETVSGFRRDLEAEVNRLAGRVDALENRLGDLAAPSPMERRKAPDAKPEKPAKSKEPKADEPLAVKAGTADMSAERPISVPSDPPAAAAEAGRDREPERGIRGRYPQLFAFHDAGKSVEYIAKKCGMNKGEVMLILQLAKREEQHRV